jgi:hypothetical protein
VEAEEGDGGGWLDELVAWLGAVRAHKQRRRDALRALSPLSPQHGYRRHPGPGGEGRRRGSSGAEGADARRPNIVLVGELSATRRAATAEDELVELLDEIHEAVLMRIDDVEVAAAEERGDGGSCFDDVDVECWRSGRAFLATVVVHDVMACAAAQDGGGDGDGGGAGAEGAAASAPARATAEEAAAEAQLELASVLCALADSLRSRVGEQHAHALPGTPCAIRPQLRWLHFHRALSQLAQDGRVLVLESEARRIAQVECSVRSEVQYDAMLEYLCDSGAIILSEGAVASSSVAFVVAQVRYTRALFYVPLQFTRILLTV